MILGSTRISIDGFNTEKLGRETEVARK